MAYPVIRYKDSTGSNTAASGAPFGMTAKTDTTEGETVSATGASNTITFSAAVDLTGVSDDDSDVIFVDHGLDERHLFRIDSFNPSIGACTSVTTNADSPVGASGISASTSWAIGGKRKDGLDREDTGGATIRVDTMDAAPGWTIEFENSETYLLDHTDTPYESEHTGEDGNPVIIKASDPTDEANLPVIDTTEDLQSARYGGGNFGHIHLQGGHYIVDGLKFTRSSGGASSTMAIQNKAVFCVIRRCRIEDSTGFKAFVQKATNSDFIVEDCFVDFTNGTDQENIIDCGNGSRSYTGLFRNTVIGSSSSGFANIYLRNVQLGGAVISDNVLISGEYGIHYEIIKDSFEMTISHNTIFSSVQDGIYFNDATVPNQMPIRVQGNLISDCGGYGINLPSVTPGFVYSAYNHFYNNTSGSMSGTPMGNTGDTSGDPGFASTSSPYDLTPSNTPPLDSAPEPEVGD